MIATPTKSLDLEPGTVASQPVSWSAYEALAKARGDRSVPRLKYINGYLHLKMPLLEQGSLDSLIAKLIMELLDRADRDYHPASPVTLKLPEVGGIEPDHLFWIEYWQAVLNKRELNLNTDPAPDIVVEADVTHYTNVNDYRLFKPKEVWIVSEAGLKLWAYHPDGYCEVETSQFFEIDVIAVFNRAIAAMQTGCSLPKAIRQALQH